MNLKCTARFNEVLLQNIIEGRIQLFADILEKQWPTKR